MRVHASIDLPRVSPHLLAENLNCACAGPKILCRSLRFFRFSDGSVRQSGNMEKYKQDLGFYCNKEPLSLTAGKILSALQSITTDQACKNDNENVSTKKYHLEVKQRQICQPVGLKSKGNLSEIDYSCVDCIWNDKVESTSLEDQIHESRTYTPLNEFQTFETPSNNSFTLEGYVTDEQASYSKQPAFTEILKKSVIVSSHVTPSVLPSSRFAVTDTQPSIKVSSISEQQKGHVQDPTTVELNTFKHENSGCLPQTNEGLKCQPGISTSEHKVMKIFKEKRESLVKGKMRLYNVESLNQEEQFKLLEETRQAKALVFTMMFHNGSSQFCVSKGPSPTALLNGIFILLKKENELACANPKDTANYDNGDTCLHLTVGEAASWRTEQSQNDFIRKLLPFLFQSKTPGICFNAKDFLRSVVPVFRKIISWKKVLESIVLDPRIAAWLLNPADSNPTFEDLVKTYCDKMDSRNTESPSDTQQQAMFKKLNVLYYLMESLQHKLQSDGLWDLFYTIELPLTTILAVMENHPIQVNMDELKRTSSVLGVNNDIMHLKDLEHEAHLAAGEKFRLTSSKELREVLYEKLHLHLQCKTKLPRTHLCRFPSTAEPALHLLKDLHPLPGIILQFRQIQKIKSTFVDGLSACMIKGCVSPTWNQTGTVSGRLSAKHPNIQGVSKLAVQFEKKQKAPGEDREIITINPRTVFISSKGHTFLAADFSQIELRLLAHFSADPELLKLFHEAEGTDIFANLASQWKEIEYKNVTQMDREQAKRIVYSVIYGVGKERLSDCLGTTPAEANKFIERFLHKYRLCDFTQTVVQECRTRGFVISLMGRKRPLPHINSKNYSLRAQAERQAVNFVIQGSAADLCKLAMIKISASIASSSSLTARLIAQIHDELLFEVEDSQVLESAGLVKHTMESVQHADGIELKVPLKVTLTSGKSWGCMTELQVK